MKISTCLSTHPAAFDAVPFKGDLAENAAAIAAAGFDGIELAVRNPASIDQQAVIDTIVAAGLAIPAIGTGQAWGEERLSFTSRDREVRDQAVARIFSHIDFARKAGAVVIIGLVRGIPDSDIPKPTVKEWLVEAFSVCCRAAANVGVRIAFEPINRYETPLLNRVDEGLEFIEKLGFDNLGMLLDTFHMNIEEPSIEESIRLAGRRIFHFHYADSNRLFPGAGHLDFRSIMQALYATDYDGFVSGEHRPDPDPLTAAREGLRYMRKVEQLLCSDGMRV